MKIQIIFLFLLSLFSSLFSHAHATPDPVKPFVVVLDAGHGGKDPGNLGNGYMEKIIALKIALKAGDILKKNREIEVIFTRDSDRFVDLFKRGEIANKAKADLFISIHCDSHTSNAHGAGTFVLGLHANKRNFEVAKKENSAIYLEDNFEQRYAQYDINSPESVIGFTIMQEEFLDQSISLAKDMQDRFANELKRNDRKVKQAGFIVLHQTFMPSVLVEAGFLTNPNEGAYLNSKKGQEEMAQAIAAAVLSYKNKLRGSSVVAQPKESTPTVPVTSAKTTPAAKEDTKSTLEKPSLEKQTKETLAADKQPEAEKLDAQKSVAEQPETTKSTAAKPAAIKPASSNAPETSATKTPPPAPSNNSGIQFKVQLMAVSKKIALNPENFKGLSDLSTETVGSLHRYLYGNVKDYGAAKDLLIQAVNAGYKTAFIVAYEGNQKIRLSEALKRLD